MASGECICCRCGTIFSLIIGGYSVLVPSAYKVHFLGIDDLVPWEDMRKGGSQSDDDDDEDDDGSDTSSNVEGVYNGPDFDDEARKNFKFL